MKLIVRPVKGESFEVDIEDGETIETMKAVIVAMNSDLGEEPDDCQLIFKGKILSDNLKTIAEYGIAENDFVAARNTKKKPAPAPATNGGYVAPAAPAAPAAPPANAQSDQVAQMAAAMAQAMQAMQASGQTPPSGGQQAPQPQAAQQQQQVDPAVAQMAAAYQQASQTPGGVLGPPSEATVAEMCGMGFDKDKVMRALRAAFNDPDRAMNFLLEDNIPNVPADEPMPQAGGGGGGAWPEGMLGPQIITKQGPKSTAEALGGCSVVLLYFSAHWCPPCKQFTPMLASAYTALGNQNNIQVVFVSSDRDELSFQNYYGSMPWLALPFASPLKQQLGAAFQIRGIPSVVAINGRTGEVLDPNAKQAIAQANFDLNACCQRWGVTLQGGTAPTPQADEGLTVLQRATLGPPAAKKEPDPGPPPTAIDDGAAKAELAKIGGLEWTIQETWYATILKVLNNMLANPAEEKFRSLKKTNAALQTKLFGVADGAAATLLKLGGFEESEEVIRLPGTPDGRCSAVRNVIKQYADQQNMQRLREERDAKIKREEEIDKATRRVAPGSASGSGGPQRNTYGADRRNRGGG
eukprot:gnl/MRDRNA2_/MRDRNA2_83551_c0_seq1.p1 gnl/MRDRNA2_/MRDRNA2_83551_c0~~gnl/MRDRNA2_/MRDRNA2_83551_c0_seq1.p1  ORF type:complete len:580 (+),score=166.65 gnl/MRDRNA2_/MRDRNA2_83551_c0_seq1:218-1957(+)